MLLAPGSIAGPQTGELGVYAGCRWSVGTRVLESLVEVCGCLEGQSLERSVGLYWKRERT